MNQILCFLIGATTTLAIQFIIRNVMLRTFRGRGPVCPNSPGGRGHSLDMRITRGKPVCVWCGAWLGKPKDTEVEALK